MELNDDECPSEPSEEICATKTDGKLENVLDTAAIGSCHSGLFSISHRCKKTRNRKKYHSCSDKADAPASNENLETTITPAKSLRRKRVDRIPASNNGLLPGSATDYSFLAGTSSNVKHERLSPSTAENSTGSHSVTPSSNSQNETSPATDGLPLGGRDYSNYIRKLAAKYNNSNPDYFSTLRNGFPLSGLTHRAKPPFSPLSFPSPLLPSLPPATTTKESHITSKKSEFSSIINPFLGQPSMFAQFIDMSATEILMGMAKTAKEAELQDLVKYMKRPDPSGPIDLSAAAPAAKRARTKTVSVSMSSNSTGTPPSGSKTPESHSPNLQDDISGWSVEDVVNFVTGIDICAEYAPIFREQQIDGSGLPLLTEEHLTQSLGMKLGPALKLRSVLAKKIGNYHLFQHCANCHTNGVANPEIPSRNGGTSPDSAASN